MNWHEWVSVKRCPRMQAENRKLQNLGESIALQRQAEAEACNVLGTLWEHGEGTSRVPRQRSGPSYGMGTAGFWRKLLFLSTAVYSPPSDLLIVSAAMPWGVGGGPAALLVQTGKLGHREVRQLA